MIVSSRSAWAKLVGLFQGERRGGGLDSRLCGCMACTLKTQLCASVCECACTYVGDMSLCGCACMYVGNMSLCMYVHVCR